MNNFSHFLWHVLRYIRIFFYIDNDAQAKAPTRLVVSHTQLYRKLDEYGQDYDASENNDEKRMRLDEITTCTIKHER